MSARLVGRVMPSYLRRRVGMQILALLIVLTAMMQLFDLLDATSDVLQRDQGVKGLIYYAFLHTPAELVLSLPLAALLGTMTSLHAMARSHEVTAMRAAGMSQLALLRYLLPVLLVLAVAQFALSEHVLPGAENTFKQWWTETAPPSDEVPDRLWAHVREGPVSIDRSNYNGRQLQGVRIYELDERGLIKGRVIAAKAHWDSGIWKLEDVSQVDVEGGQIVRRHVDARDWQSNLRPADVLRLDVVRPRLSSRMLADVIAGSRVGSQPLSYYQTALYRSFTAPLGPIIMLLLALPTAFWLTRDSGGGRGLLICLVLGLAYLLSDGIIATLGSSGRVPPLAAALAAPVFFILVGLVRLRSSVRL